MKNNFFANALLVLIGVLLLLAALQMFGWGQGTSSLEADPFDETSLNQLDLGENAQNNIKIDDEVMVKITDAPLFSYDRMPYIPTEETDLTLAGEDEVVEPDPLKAKVTSIIITDENSYAMVFDQVSNTSVTLKQGMPLPGDQGLWTVDNINPRAVTFVAEGEEPVELGLEVFDGQLNAKAPNSRKNNRNQRNNNNKNNNNQNNTAQKNSAEEIRKKIAERRAQMRANAAKGKKE